MGGDGGVWGPGFHSNRISREALAQALRGALPLGPGSGCLLQALYAPVRLADSWDSAPRESGPVLDAPPTAGDGPGVGGAPLAHRAVETAPGSGGVRAPGALCAGTWDPQSGA